MREKVERRERERIRGGRKREERGREGRREGEKWKRSLGTV